MYLSFSIRKRCGFTLIELLIVIAIILILIAIALPNFLEAQIRARVTKANGEMKSLVVATESYRIDWGKEPIAMVPPEWNQSTYEADGGQGVSFWGFTSYSLTTPNEYLTAIPVNPFYDSIFTPADYQLIGNEYPYTFVRDTATMAQPIGLSMGNNPGIQDIAGGPVPISESFNRRTCHSGYIYYSSGPDTVDSTVHFMPAEYAPTNGTKSFGDIYMWGNGTPYDDIKDTYYLTSRDSVRSNVAQNCN